MRGQQGFLRAVEEKVNSLKKGMDELIRDMNALIKREVLCAFYTALGHQDTTPRSPTYERTVQHQVEPRGWAALITLCLVFLYFSCVLG